MSSARQSSGNSGTGARAPAPGLARIQTGDQVFIADGGDEVGAVRDVYPDGIIVYVENAGDFRVPLAAVESVHSQKVILACDRLGRSLRRAIGHAHDAEKPGF